MGLWKSVFRVYAFNLALAGLHIATSTYSVSFCFTWLYRRNCMSPLNLRASNIVTLHLHKFENGRV